MKGITILDTSILCEVLQVPGKSQNPAEVRAEFEACCRQDEVLLPWAVVLECANHVAQCNGDRHRLASRLVDLAKQAEVGQAPFALAGLPDRGELRSLLDRFPSAAAAGRGLVDESLIDLWQRQKELFQGRRVRIWSLDRDLSGYAG